MKNTASNPCNYPNDMWNIEPVAHIHEKAASSMLDTSVLYDEVTFYQDMAQIAAQNFLHDGLYPEKAMYYEACASIYQKELFRRVIRCVECANTAGNCICTIPVEVLSQCTEPCLTCDNKVSAGIIWCETCMQGFKSYPVPSVPSTQSTCNTCGALDQFCQCEEESLSALFNSVSVVNPVRPTVRMEDTYECETAQETETLTCLSCGKSAFQVSINHHCESCENLFAIAEPKTYTFGETIALLYNPNNYLARSAAYFQRILSQEFDITNSGV